MIVLGIGGSPKIGGNTDRLLDAALAGAKSIGESVQSEKIILNKLNIQPCQECGGCDKTGICVVQDEMQMMYQKLRTADRVILASPIYFMGVTGQLKMMIDRSQAVWITKYVLKQPVSETADVRKGIFISVRAQKGMTIFDCASKVVTAFFATHNIQYTSSLFFDKIDEQHPIEKHPTALATVYLVGAKLAK
jgi:multimeric flavodoxin WrbA